jgi:hypothetical protein
MVNVNTEGLPKITASVLRVDHDQVKVMGSGQFWVQVTGVWLYDLVTLYI